MRKAVILLVSFLVCTVIFAQKEIVRKEKNVTVFLDRQTSVKTYKYTDGRIVSVDLKGKTPYGIAIDEVIKPLQNKPVPVKLTFSAEDSDEAMSEDLRYMFDELYNSLKGVVGGSRYKGNKPLNVVVSYCRYGEYGYCYKKTNAVYIRFMEEGKSLKTYKFASVSLKDKKQRVIFLTKVIKDFSKL